MLSNTAIRKIFWGIAGFGTSPTKVIIECGLSDKPQASEKAKLVVLPQLYICYLVRLDEQLGP